LTRSKAAELISAKEEFSKRRPSIYTTNLRQNNQAALQCGRGSLWEWTADYNPRLMSAGEKLYESAKTFVINGTIQFTLRTPPKLVEVTGMSGEGQERHVEFNWEYDGVNSLSPEVSRCIEAVGGAQRAEIAGSLGQHKGVADLQLYDDGWRVIHLQL